MIVLGIIAAVVAFLVVAGGLCWLIVWVAERQP